MRSISPLEQSIERALEKTHEQRRWEKAVDNDYDEPTSLSIPMPTKNSGAFQDDKIQYANWQFAQMNEKSHLTKSVDSLQQSLPLPNGGAPISSKAAAAPTKKSFFGTPSKKPLKLPSPFKLQNLSDLTALENSIGNESTVTTGASLEASVESLGAGGRSYEEAVDSSEFEQKIIDKPPANRPADLLLPSQLGTSKSYGDISKKKIPPASVPGKLSRQLSAKDHEEKESSGELGSSSEFTSRKSFKLLQGKLPSSSKLTASTEFIRKLSLRRQKLEKQLSASNNHTSTSTSSSLMDGSSRCTSTSSSQSELVCTYNTKRTTGECPLDSMEESVELREREGDNLAKYGILEDTEGGSFVI